MDAGICDYVIGKYGSAMGPAFVALINAIDGHADVVKNADGTASRLVARFWSAKSKEDFNEKLSFDNNANPGYNKTVMDKYIVRLNSGVTRQQFADFVAFTYDDLKALHK
jgi:hypothetical protein